MKYLFIHFSAVSKIIFSTPAIRCLKNKFPDASIHFLTMDGFRSAIDHNPHVDKVQVLAHSRELMIEELKSDEYDHIIDLENNELSRAVRQQFPKAKTFIVSQHSFANIVYRRLHLDLFPKIHLADEYLGLLKSLDVKNDQAGLDYFISKEEETRREDIPASHHAGFIAICITGSVQHAWSTEKWKECCRLIDHPVILLGDVKDRSSARDIASVDPVKVYSAIGKFSMNELADLVKKSKIILTPSSQWMYIATAFKRPVVWLNDGTLPSNRVAPYYGDLFLSGRSRAPFTMCGIKDEVPGVVKSVLGYL